MCIFNVAFEYRILQQDISELIKVITQNVFLAFSKRRCDTTSEVDSVVQAGAG